MMKEKEDNSLALVCAGGDALDIELLHDDDMREEGREEERANTEREKVRADALEAKVRKLEEMLNNRK